MAARYAWVLNLDADLELAAMAAGGGAYTPPERVREAVRTFAPVVAVSLLGPEDVLVDERSEPGVAEGLVGRAFCPTPRAVSLLVRAGAQPEPHPALDVLRRVGSRAFAAALGPTLEGAAFVSDLEEARRILASAPPVGDAWRMKRAYAMTGRGQRVVAAGAASEADLAALRAGIAEGGVQIEPNVPIVVEYALHGMLAADGALACGLLVVQRCDARGAWVATEPAPSDTPAEVETALREEASRVGAALSAAGYFGPFGLDAFTFRDRDGRTRLRTRSEVNARYTMGFGVGFRGRARAGRG